MGLAHAGASRARASGPASADSHAALYKADATTISNKDSKESGGEMQMLEATETTLYKQNASLVRPSMRPRDLKLNKEQRHDKLGHFGSHRNCIHCQQVKQRPRRVYKNPTPVYDHIPGRSIHMDSMYIDVQSRHGDWYCAPGWDDCTGYLNGMEPRQS